MFGVKTRFLSVLELIRDDYKRSKRTGRYVREMNPEKIKRTLMSHGFFGKFYNESFHQQLTKFIEKNNLNLLFEMALESVLENKYKIYKSMEIKIPTPLDWFKDPITLKKWPNYHKKYMPVMLEAGTDILTIWELNRFNQIPFMGLGYFLTKDVAYKQKFMCLISSWKKQVHRNIGPHWLDAMEIALRSINWIWGFVFFYDSHEKDSEFWLDYINYLWEDGFQIMRELPVRTNSNGMKIKHNHYMISIIGLFMLGVIFGHSKEGKIWYRYGKEELFTEIIHQFPNGINFEGAFPDYHIFVLDSASIALHILHAEGENIPESVYATLVKAFDFIERLEMPNGEFPLVGDSSDMIFFPLEHLLGSGLQKQDILKERKRVLLGDCEPQNIKSIENFLLNYGTAFKKHQIKKSVKIKQPDLTIMGEYVIYKKNGNYLFINFSGSCSDGFNNHKHSDLLNFVLMKKYKPFFVDPGTYSYTAYPEERNKYRSSSFHNVVMIDDQDIIPFNRKNLFRMNSDVKAILKQENETGKFYELVFNHNGYMGHPEKILSTRSFIIFKNEFRLEIIDSFKKLNDNVRKIQATLNLHLHPDVRIIDVDKKGLTLHFEILNNDIPMQVIIGSECEILNFRIETYGFAPSYLKKLNAKKIIAEFNIFNGCKIKTVFI